MTSNLPTSSAIESRHIDYIPESERHGKVWRQGPFWFLGNFQPFSVSIGLVGPLVGLNLFWSSVSAILGVLFGTLFMAAHAAQGPRLGLPQMVQSRAQFGYTGVILPLLATIFTFIGFLVADCVILKVGLNSLFGWNENVVVVALMALSLLMAIYGHDWIHRVFIWLFWLSMPFWLILFIGIALHSAGGHGHDAGAFNVAGFFVMFSLAASYNITYAPYVSDYSRYLPSTTSQRSIIWSVFIGASAPLVFLIPLGAWLGIYLGTSDTLRGLHNAGNHVVGGAGTLLIFFSVLALLATMGMGVYSGMLSVLTAVDSYRPVASGPKARLVASLLVAVIALFFGLVLNSVTTTLYDSLTIMLYLLAPWTAVNLIDFYVMRHGKFSIIDFFIPNGIYGRWGTRGIIAYLAGIAVELPLMSIPSYYTSPGFTWLKGVDISWMVGLFVAGLVYWFLTRGEDRTAEIAAVARSEEAILNGEVLR